ncbi:helix-turn-helix transcriptional regulator [Pseudonocardia sp. H11422]|uniref:helix-turn-helix transcriptional regulator n=1 Tax=Pseudonocardia sp. H11422 TaxID=2835866 RepID=UPI00202934F5|nr:LuxR C-terminal-related transcriptional regulator [Pseudonocardia sp. H11422]
MDSSTSTSVVPRRVRTTLGEPALRAVATIAAVGSSGARREDRVRLILDELRSIVPYQAVMLAGADPVSGRTRRVVQSGYPAHLSDYMTGDGFRTEMIEPFAHALRGWPVRECDLPIDPLSLRPIAEHLRPAGYPEGLLMALTVDGGRDVGFLIMSVDDARTPPSDEAITSIGHVAAVLGNLVDPLGDARRLTSVLDEEQTAVAILPDGTTTALRGTAPPDLLEPRSRLRQALDRLTRSKAADTAFTWLDDDGAWYGCRLLRCRDGIRVLTMTESEQRHRLTRRELEVLTHLAAGSTNDEIAAELVVTTRTVRAHVERVMEKLGVGSRSGAAARAIREGLLIP